MKYPEVTKQILRPVAILCFLMFMGRAYQHLFWDAPYRTLLWEEEWLEGFVNWLGLDWKTYVTSVQADRSIQLVIKMTGLLYIVCAFICLAMRQGVFKKLQPILHFGIISLALLFFLLTKEKFFHIGQFFEHTAQLACPMVLLLLVNRKINTVQLIFVLKIAIALTFCCHGLYAIGYYPRPGVFVDMVINTFGCSEAFAHQFLWLAGLLDFVVAIALFIPQSQKVAVYYVLIWGFVTALARTTAFFDWTFPFQSLHQNVFQSMVRLPHGGLPLVLGVTYGYFQLTRRKNKSPEVALSQFIHK